jgi:hypothetical protein
MDPILLSCTAEDDDSRGLSPVSGGDDVVDEDRDLLNAWRSESITHFFPPVRLHSWAYCWVVLAVLVRGGGDHLFLRGESGECVG